MGFNLNNLPNLFDLFTKINVNDKVIYIGKEEKEGIKSGAQGTVFGMSENKDGIESLHVIFNNIMLKLTKQEIKKIK